MTALRFQLAPGQALAFAADPPPNTSPLAHERLLELYYDTADLALWRAGWRLSTRWRTGRWQLRLQGGDLKQPLLWDVQDCAVDCTKLPFKGRLGQTLLELLEGQELSLQLRLDGQRQIWEWVLAAGGRGRVTLEQGAVQVADLHLRFHELALSLPPLADETRWTALQQLLVPYEAVPSLQEPVVRGFERLRQAVPAFHKAQRAELDRGLSIEQAFARIVESCCRHFLANEEAVRAGDVEGVHQMRVALRRLRSCLRLFRALVPRAASAELVEEIRWLNGLLAAARDWDVFQSEGLQPLREHFPKRRGLAMLWRQVEQHRRQCYQRLHQGLELTRYRRLTLQLWLWLCCRRWRTGLTAQQYQALQAPLAAFAKAELRRLRRRVRRLGERFDSLDGAQRHRLRIRIKQLRYATEFFADLYLAARSDAFRQALSTLQDHLGAMNDALMTRRLLDELELAAANATRALVEGWYGGRMDLQLRDFAPYWQAFRDCRPPWKGR
ncbi:MAG TPA: CHAD domain-containing protein [Candidatus Competibacteraceae bacterium]|nr:CHAD domain-containing protein [Candidatus Competibacteraceae bacterium]